MRFTSPIPTNPVLMLHWQGWLLSYWYIRLRCVLAIQSTSVSNLIDSVPLFYACSTAVLELGWTTSCSGTSPRIVGICLSLYPHAAFQFPRSCSGAKTALPMALRFLLVKFPRSLYPEQRLLALPLLSLCVMWLYRFCLLSTLPVACWAVGRCRLAVPAIRLTIASRCPTVPHSPSTTRSQHLEAAVCWQQGCKSLRRRDGPPLDSRQRGK